MKNLTTLLTTLLLTFLLLSAAKCQEPDLQSYSDSLHNAVVDSIVNYKDSIIANRDNAIVNKDVQIAILTSDLINRQYSDTTSISLEGMTDSTLTTINKAGENITVTIKNGDKRITSIFSEGKRNVFFMNDFITDTSKSIGSFQLDDSDKVSFSYDPKNAIE